MRGTREGARGTSIRCPAWRTWDALRPTDSISASNASLASLTAPRRTDAAGGFPALVEHIERLLNSAKILLMEIPYTVDENGAYTEQAPGFTGKRVITDKGEKGDANEAVIKALIENGTLPRLDLVNLESQAKIAEGFQPIMPAAATGRASTFSTRRSGFALTA